MHLALVMFPQLTSKTLDIVLCSGVNLISFLSGPKCYAFAGASGNPAGIPAAAAAIWPVPLRDETVSGVRPEPG